MVMFPWKQPRLNDGYHDRNSTHSYENSDRHMGKGVSSSYGSERDRYDRRSSQDYRHSRDASPSRNSPRYSNKLSYISRNKDRYEKESKKSPSTYRSARPDAFSKNGERARENEYSRDSNGSHSKEREQKNEVQNTALRMCGDWSEHVSSSGKKYYYNCKTEVSKWEKPKEWTLDTPSKSRRDRDRDRHSNSSSSGGARHSANRQDDKNRRSRESSPSRKDYRYSEKRDKCRTAQNKYSTSHDDASQRTLSLKPVTNYNSISQERRNDPQWSTNSYNRKPGDRQEEYRRENENRDIRGSVDMDISPDSTPPREVPAQTAPPSSRASGAPHGRPPPSSYQPPATSTATTTFLSSVLTQLGDQNLLQNIDSKKLQEQALQTLHQLKQAISCRQVSIQNAGSTQSPRVPPVNSSGHDDTPLTQQSPYGQHSPHNSQKGNTTPLTSEKPYVPPAGQTTPQRNVATSATPAHTYRSQQSMDEEPPGKSPASENSASRADRSSPTPSHNSSQGGVAGLAAAAQKQQQQTIQLPPSLANYYKEELTHHVVGWQTNHAEKQANRYRDEAHIVGNRASTQLSVELKRARSLVRAAEINTTLQEQRILFIRQQIMDLERGTKN